MRIFVAINFVASCFAHSVSPPIDNSTADCGHGVTCFPCHPKLASATIGKCSWGALTDDTTHRKPPALPVPPGVNCSATNNICYHNKKNIISNVKKVHTVCRHRCRRGKESMRIINNSVIKLNQWLERKISVHIHSKGATAVVFFSDILAVTRGLLKLRLTIVATRARPTTNVRVGLSGNKTAHPVREREPSSSKHTCTFAHLSTTVHILFTRAC